MTKGRFVDVDVTEQQHGYVLALVKTGLYGSTDREVIHTLLMEGLRKAITDGFITVTLPSWGASRG